MSAAIGWPLVCAKRACPWPPFLFGEQMGRPFKGTTAADRLWPRVNKNGPVPPHRPELGRCWEWTGGLDTNGYGQFYASGRPVGTHRVAFLLARGPIPADLWVLHHCDNRKCVNPDHLFLGTHADNMADMTAKGRRAPLRPYKGEANGRAKLTADSVRAIRCRLGEGRQQRAIAREFGISDTVVWQIAHGLKWQHIA